MHRDLYFGPNITKQNENIQWLAYAIGGVVHMTTLFIGSHGAHPPPTHLGVQHT